MCQGGTVVMGRGLKFSSADFPSAPWSPCLELYSDGVVWNEVVHTGGCGKGSKKMVTWPLPQS